MGATARQAVLPCQRLEPTFTPKGIQMSSASHWSSRRPAWGLLALLFVILLPLTEARRAAADEGAGERHPYRFDGSVVATWLAESLIDLSPDGVNHMDMYEVTRVPRQFKPTAEERATADALVADAKIAADRNGWHDFEKAMADGYEVMAGDTAHYAKRAFLQDGKVLDVDHPEFLMYYDTDSGKKLAGYMFLVEEAMAEGPQIGGPLTRWHFHIWEHAKCLHQDLLVIGDADENGQCAEGVANHRSPEMIHVWLTDHPEGAFATKMHLEKWQVNDLEHGHHHH